MKLEFQLVLFAVLWTDFAFGNQSVLNPFELKSRSEENGMITMWCCNATSGDELDTATVYFWLNRTSANDCDLRERNDVQNTVADHFSIQFNLTRNLEGSYTCGMIDAGDNVQESSPQILICELDSYIALLFAGIMQLPKLTKKFFSARALNLDSNKTTFTATPNSTAELHCPIEPGALVQYYSVRWSKDGVLIASLILGRLVSTDSHYNLDRSTFSLIINNVNMSDSSASYKCEVFVQYSRGDNKRLSPDISLTLYVHGK